MTNDAMKLMTCNDVEQDDECRSTDEDSPSTVVLDGRTVELTPAEALQRLREGQPLSNVRIVGLCLRGTFEKPIEMRNVMLVDLRCQKAAFQQPVHLYSCTVIKPKFHKRVIFEQDFALAGSRLRNASLTDMTVRGAFRCDNMETSGSFRVLRSTFEGDIRFWEAKFCGWVDLHESTVRGQADLRSFQADQGVGITKCRFEKDVLLRGSTIAKKLTFDGSSFQGMLDLSKTKLHDFVYLEDIQQGPAQRFAFANAVAERIRIGQTQLTGRLVSELNGDHATAMSEYGFLKRNYESLHRYEDEDWAFYRFKVNQRQAKTRDWWRPWTVLARTCDFLFLDLGCGYGTNPLRAVVSAILIMFLFGALYAAGFHNFEATQIANWPADSLLNRVAFGFVTSVSVFTAGFTGDHLHNARGWILFPLAVEALMGTLLWGLFIVAFSRKVIR